MQYDAAVVLAVVMCRVLYVEDHMEAVWGRRGDLNISLTRVPLSLVIYNLWRCWRFGCNTISPGPTYL